MADPAWVTSVVARSTASSVAAVLADAGADEPDDRAHPIPPPMMATTTLPATQRCQRATFDRWALRTAARVVRPGAAARVIAENSLSIGLTSYQLASGGRPTLR